MLAVFACLLGMPPALVTGFASGIPEPSQIWYGTVWNRVDGVNVRVTTGQLTWQCRPLDGGSPVVLSTSLTNINDQFSFALEVPCESLPPGSAGTPNTLAITSPPRVYVRTNVALEGQPLFLGPSDSPMFEAVRGQLVSFDLSMVRLDIDSDQDGLPDWWEDQYFAGQADPGDDPDGDGLNNEGEYRAGTDPLDPESLFAFIAISPHAAGGIQIEWASSPGRLYTVERSGDLFQGFTSLAAGLPATPPANTYHDASATGAGPYFFRIRLEP